MRLAGKTAIVTGASAGMGEAIAALFAREGVNVVAVARRLDRLEQLGGGGKGRTGKDPPLPGGYRRAGHQPADGGPGGNVLWAADILVNNARHHG